MASFLENNYNHINKIFSIVVAGLVAVVGGAWLIENKDKVFRSPVKWVTDQATKEDPSLPKFEPIKPIEMIDPNKIMNGGITFDPNKTMGIERKNGKSSSTSSPMPAGKTSAEMKDLKGKK
jgi:hypothetical protein